MLFYYPERVRHKVIEITKPTATLINFSVIYKNIIKWFYEDGAEFVMASKMYHVNWAKVLLVPQGYLLSFQKKKKNSYN